MALGSWRRLIGKHSHVSWAVLDQALVSGVNFVTGILLARLLGLEEFGLFSFAWMVAIFINNQQIAMIVSPMMSIGPKHSSADAPSYYGAVIVQLLVYTVASTLLTFFLAKFGGLVSASWKLGKVAEPLALAVCFYLLQDFVRRYFFTIGKTRIALANDVISYAGQVVLFFGFSRFFRLDGAGVLWITALTSAFAVAVGVFNFEKVRFDRLSCRAVALRHWQSSSWIALSALLQWLSSQGVILITGSVLGPASLGGMRAVLNLVAPVNIIMQAMQNTLPVEASRVLDRHGHDALVRYLKKQCCYILFVVGLISLLASVFSDALMGLVYGSSFTPFAYLVKWQSLYAVLSAVIAPIVVYFRTIEKTRSFFSCTAIATLCSLAALAALVTRYHEGAVYAGLLCSQLIMLMLLLFSLRTFSMAKGAELS